MEKAPSTRPAPKKRLAPHTLEVPEEKAFGKGNPANVKKRRIFSRRGQSRKGTPPSERARIVAATAPPAEKAKAFGGVPVEIVDGKRVNCKEAVQIVEGLHPEGPVIDFGGPFGYVAIGKKSEGQFARFDRASFDPVERAEREKAGRLMEAASWVPESARKVLAERGWRPAQCSPEKRVLTLRQKMAQGTSEITVYVSGPEVFGPEDSRPEGSEPEGSEPERSRLVARGMLYENEDLTGLAKCFETTTTREEVAGVLASLHKAIEDEATILFSLKERPARRRKKSQVA